MGIKAESYLVPGGLGIKILGNSNQNLQTLHSLPIVECDLSQLDYFDYTLLNREKISSLTLPREYSRPFPAFLTLILSI